jgi:hypothetical protein
MCRDLPKLRAELTARSPEQVRAWNLPPRRTKARDSRAKNFGDSFIELDAIWPDRLCHFVERVIQRHLPPKQFKVLKAAEASEHQWLNGSVGMINSAAPQCCPHGFRAGSGAVAAKVRMARGCCLPRDGAARLCALSGGVPDDLSIGGATMAQQRAEVFLIRSGWVRASRSTLHVQFANGNFAASQTHFFEVVGIDVGGDEDEPADEPKLQQAAS